jgi:molecular chaperone GrpE
MVNSVRPNRPVHRDAGGSHRYTIPVRVGEERPPTRTSPDAFEVTISPKAPTLPTEPAEGSVWTDAEGDARIVDVRSGGPATSEKENVSASSAVPAPAVEGAEERDWQALALRLQAEMDSYRKRQQRVAQEQARAEQVRVLVDMLGVADNLERTLAAAQADTPLRRGVVMTRDEMLRLLRKHGVERIQSRGQPFDPTRHEAVDVVSAAALGVEPGTIVRVDQPGYLWQERLIRPARVVVAQ